MVRGHRRTNRLDIFKGKSRKKRLQKGCEVWHFSSSFLLFRQVAAGRGAFEGGGELKEIPEL